ncbi:glucosylglycerol-phosphate synthase [cyanobacterium endosymbiont of Epithemia turgida]|uniref:glucosylglycerol-phosphate synthase n=1 Tax=cyanobacterium endosymbiont of Epithemia turgida TaxID=718217 RepID=UPI0004D0EA31|nr:glucosylglycerol-phosphate synthase [cyanobacterium endosymbiont of Epithemia turgida]BAP17112.1 glucosylglycerol-phosphate synthase [cyanobacterium endosymbiont of Epithemia turgida isolate EtSB Lake Yunoko]
MKSSLVILYHREPYDEVVENGKIHYRPKKSPNGIVPTLKSFFTDVGQGTWIAWKQVSNEQKATFTEQVTVKEDASYTVHRIPLDANQVKHFYHITSKEAFWPILHSFPSHFTSESSDWDNFTEINRLFADAACKEAADDALVWVHDYNLWLVPYYIRQKMPNVRIAFFHHTPFPPADIFNILPWREAILDSLLCCDVVGFHIPRYSENFVNVARSLREVKIVQREKVAGHMTSVGIALAEPERTTKLSHKEQIINIDAFPVGTNPKNILEVLNKPEIKIRLEQIREELQGRKLLVAAGRVDYVKGNSETLEAFGRLLERRPDLHGKINLVMTCVQPATGMRVYETAQKQIEQLVGKINGQYAKFDWTPIQLFTQPLPLEDLFCYYRVADICWTTPLRDGLNLVAKEYIVAHEGKDGVLILSEFVGAAIELPQAILTNPYSIDRMDQAIEEALAMPLEDQKKRMTEMYKTVTTYDVSYWANRLFKLFKEIKHETVLDR